MHKAQKFCLHVLAEGEQQQLMVYWIAPCFLELFRVFLWVAENLVLCAGLILLHQQLPLCSATSLEWDPSPSILP